MKAGRRAAWDLALVVVMGAFCSPISAPAQDRRCLFQIVNVDRQLVRIEPAPGTKNVFAGGNVHLRCSGQQVDMFSDSVASYQGKVVQFIGKVRYRDSTISMDADFGTYFKDGEHWDAQGNVRFTDRKDGSAIRGPMVNFYRAVKGVREEAEIYADQRPTVTYAVKDSLERSADPYVIIGDRVRIRGNDKIWAGGTVTIDRSDLRGRGDSLRLDSGKAGDGSLLGHASLRSVGRDSFELVGASIDLALDRRELVGVKAKDSARLRSPDVSLFSDSIRLALKAKQVDRTTAWGKTVRPRAVSADYEIRGDSIVIETPEQRLDEVRAYGSAWAGMRPDSVGTGRDWIAGEMVTARFADRDSAGPDRKPAIERLEASQQARSYYRLPTAGQAGGRSSVNYNRANRIIVTLKVWPDSATVVSVDAQGNVDGVHLEPGVTRPDSTRRDTARVDTTAARRRPW